MTNKFSLLIKKYSVPALFLAFAIAMFYIVITTHQNQTFIVATVMMFVAGILTLLYSSGVISSKILTILGVAAFIGAVGTIYTSTSSVVSTQKHIKRYKLLSGKAALNLGDVRSAQKAFMEENGHYTASWDTLIEFINNGKVPYVRAIGVVPSRKITSAENSRLYRGNPPINNNMTEEEALNLALSSNPPADLKDFKRDTIMISFLKSKFQNRSYLASREANGFGRFSVDSLPYIPGTSTQWDIKTLDTLRIIEDLVPAIKVWGKLPIAEIEGTDPEEFSFGSLTNNETAGSWEQN